MREFTDFDLVPPDERADWLDAQFGVDHEDYGLTGAKAERLSYVTLTKALRLLLAHGEGRKHGLQLANGGLSISHALRVRLYRDLRGAGSPVSAPAGPQALHEKSVRARAFLREWARARKALHEGNRQSGLRLGFFRRLGGTF